MRTSIRTRLLASFLAIAIAAAGGLSLYFLSELEDYALRNLEARLDAEARLIAALLEATLSDTGVDQVGELPDGTIEEINTALADLGPGMTTRLRVLDEQGVAVADSVGDIGAAYGDRPEVVDAFTGRYGAYTRILDDDRVALYVARDIEVDGEVVGAVYSSASTFSIMTLLRDYRAQMFWGALLFVALLVFVIELLSRWLSAPLQDLEAGAQAIAAGDHSFRVEPSGARETRALAAAFNTMSAEVEQFVSGMKAERRREARFVSDVSHELRTPLTSIRGAAETLAQGDVEEADTMRFLGTIVRESERLSRLAEDLLVLQRIEGTTGELPISRVDLADVVGRTVEGLEHVLTERGVAVEVTTTKATVLGDADRLQQVVANLLDNASRVTPEGGTVTVTASRTDALATITVTDGGPGIGDEALPHLFDRFYRAQASRDRKTGGPGLGLAIVKAIVEAHGGAVEAADLPEGGARFTVSLPAAPE